MLVPLDVDCGEVLPGHRLVVRGLRDAGCSDDATNGDCMDHYEGKPVHRVASLVYALVPGLSLEEHQGHLDIDVRVTLDPQPDPVVWGSALTMGGERDARAGRAETVGVFGPFVLPEATRRLVATVTQIALSRFGEPSSPTRGAGDLGAVEVDLASGAAHWTPA